MVDFGEVAEAGMNTYAYTKQQELIAKNPEYRKYSEHQNRIGLYVVGGLAVLVGGIFFMTKSNERKTTFGNELSNNKTHTQIFIRAKQSRNVDAIRHIAALFESRGYTMCAANLRQHANTL